MRRRRLGRNISRNIPAPPSRPPDPRAIRRRQEGLEVQLDIQELARRRAAIDADLAAAMAPPTPAREPARPPPSHPILVVPVRRVVTATALAVLVRAWDLEVWIPKSAIHHHDVDSLLSGWSGSLEISSWWAHRVDLPPASIPRSNERIPR